MLTVTRRHVGAHSPDAVDLTLAFATRISNPARQPRNGRQQKLMQLPDPYQAESEPASSVKFAQERPVLSKEDPASWRERLWDIVTTTST